MIPIRINIATKILAKLPIRSLDIERSKTSKSATTGTNMGRQLGPHLSWRSTSGWQIPSQMEHHCNALIWLKWMYWCLQKASPTTMSTRVFHKWHFVKEKKCNTSTHPSWVYINQIWKNFFPKKSLDWSNHIVKHGQNRRGGRLTVAWSFSNE